MMDVPDEAAKKKSKKSKENVNIFHKAASKGG